MSQLAHGVNEIVQWIGIATYPFRRLCSFLVQLLLSPFYLVYEAYLTAQLSSWQRPRHIGIIMDGNRRFARSFNLGNILNGHEKGAAKLEEVLNWCVKKAVKCRKNPLFRSSILPLF